MLIHFSCDEKIMMWCACVRSGLDKKTVIILPHPTHALCMVCHRRASTPVHTTAEVSLLRMFSPSRCEDSVAESTDRHNFAMARLQVSTHSGANPGHSPPRVLVRMLTVYNSGFFDPLLRLRSSRYQSPERWRIQFSQSRELIFLRRSAASSPPARPAALQH